MKQRKILRINEIKINEDKYPRLYVEEDTIEKYAELMKSGVIFPEIIVAQIGDNYWLVDGRHRLEARRQNGEDNIQVEVLMGLTERDIYIESVKLNLEHGRPLDKSDLKQIKITLEEWEVSQEDIKQILRIDVDKLHRPKAYNLDDFKIVMPSKQDRNFIPEEISDEEIEQEVNLNNFVHKLAYCLGVLGRVSKILGEIKETNKRCAKNKKYLGGKKNRNILITTKKIKTIFKEIKEKEKEIDKFEDIYRSQKIKYFRERKNRKDVLENEEKELLEKIKGKPEEDI